MVRDVEHDGDEEGCEIGEADNLTALIMSVGRRMC